MHRIIGAMSRILGSLFLVILSTAALAQTAPDLWIHAFTTPTVAPGARFTHRLDYANRGDVTAGNVIVTFTAAATIVSAPANCEISGQRAICALSRLEPRQSGRIELELIAPDLSEHTFPLTAEIAANETDADPSNDRVTVHSRTFRTFFVTTTADDGSGSLRQAIESANGSCDNSYPCLVAFRIAGAGQQWQTIRVASPLPRVVATQLLIDGMTQTAYFGDTNPLGPEIELTGSEGNGLEIATPCGVMVRGLAINGFGGAGVVIGGGFCEGANNARLLSSNYIGTDPTGDRAVPNDRGVVVDLEPGATPWLIGANVISGNRRSGIFIESGANLRIAQNVMGLDARVTRPLGNGASGVFIAARGAGANLWDNHLSFNGQFGVALARGAQHVQMSGNSFQANGLQAIDYDLDNMPSEREIGIPEITSVRFEDGATIIEGRAKPSGGATLVSVYANDAPDDSGYGEGQYFLGTIAATAGAFTFRHTGDLRGKWVAATQTRHLYTGLLRTDGAEGGLFTTTSEFSRAVEVQ